MDKSKDANNAKKSLQNLKSLKPGDSFQFYFPEVAKFITANPLPTEDYNSFLNAANRLEWTILSRFEDSEYGTYLMFFPRKTQLRDTQIFLIAKAKKLSRKILLTPQDKRDSNYIQLKDRSFHINDMEGLKLQELTESQLKEHHPLCHTCHDTGQYKYSPSGSTKLIDRYCNCRAGIRISHRGTIMRVTNRETTN